MYAFECKAYIEARLKELFKTQCSHIRKRQSNVRHNLNQHTIHHTMAILNQPRETLYQ